MKSWTVCIALSLLSAAAIAQQQGGPPPGYQDQQGDGPPPGYQGQDDGPPPGYQDQQGDGPPPGYQDQGNGPPPGYDDPQDEGPPRGDDGRQGGAPPPGYGDRPDRTARGGMVDRQGNAGRQGFADRGAATRQPDGLGGWVLVTSDENWQAKWETAATAMPTFTTVRDLARGKKAFVLIFFANPSLDGTGQANVGCDIELTRPDGSVSTRQADATCFSGKLDGDARDTYLSAPVIGFVGDPRDPAGTWRIKVTLKDNNRHTSVPLQASFNLKN